MASKQKTKKVVRRWTTKSGVVKTKVYEYAHKSTKGLTLINKKGVVIKSNVEKFKATIDAGSGSDVQKRRLKADLDNYIRLRKGQKRALTTKGFMGHLEENLLERMFVNVGWSSVELAEALDIEEDELLDMANWTISDAESYFKVNGKTYKFNWTYTGNVLEEVNGSI